MRLQTLSGRLVNKDYKKYLINWSKKEASNFQTEVKFFLYSFLKNHIVFSEFPIVGTRYRIDIFDATTKTAYEIVGVQHTKFVKFFHGNSANYLAQIKRDVKKEKFCEINNIKLIEILPEDLPLTKDFFKNKFNLDL